jgi:hypothetical protein
MRLFDPIFVILGETHEEPVGPRAAPKNSPIRNIFRLICV